MSLIEPVNSSILFLIFSKAKFNSFYRHYLSSGFMVVWQFSSRIPSCWSICVFFAIMHLVLPSLGSGKIRWSPGDVPNILFLIYFLSLIKLPLGPSISDSRKMNLPLMLPWSRIFSTKSNSLSKATSLALFLRDSSDKNNFG